MKKFTPHITFFGALFVITIIGIIANSAVIAKLSGALVAFSIDPLLIIGGLVIGSLVKNQIKLFMTAIAFGIVASIIITSLNASLGSTLSPITIILRCISTLSWAYVASIFVVIRLNTNINNTSDTYKTENDNQSTSSKSPNNDLIFKDNMSAFEYACKYLDCTLKEGAMLPAIVLDSKEVFGTEHSVKTQDDGSQLAMIKVASNDGGFTVPANTSGNEGAALKPGDFVAWQAMQHMPEMSKMSGDSRFGWVGLIIGTLKPELSNDGWAGDNKL